jgi:N-acetylneuraminic acid mutarotase
MSITTPCPARVVFEASEQGKTMMRYRHHPKAWERAVLSIAVLALVAGTLFRSTLVHAAGTAGLWTELPYIPNGHSGHTATLLGDGKVLIAGGFTCTSGGSTCVPTAKADLYRPATNDWISVGSLSVVRIEDDAALLKNGKVLVAGGANGANLATNVSSAEIFDPATLSWNPAASMSKTRSGLTLTRLFDGRVLAVGGRDNTVGYVAAAELYDPTTNSWSPAANMSYARVRHTATLLRDGRVLVVGGDGTAGARADAEIYDPATNTWSSTAGTMSSARRFHQAVLLPAPLGVPRKVLVVGGRSDTVVSLATADVYDPATDTWTQVASMADGRSVHTATLLREGTVLVAGGLLPNGNDFATSAELYDPATDTWSMAATMPRGLMGHSATLLTYQPSSKALFAGDSPGATFAFMYQPSPINAFTTLFSSANPASSCATLTLTADVVSTTGLGLATGMVQFKDGTTGLGTKPLNQYGQATLTVGPLSAGMHNLSAAYGGDAAFNASTGTLSQSVTAFAAIISPEPAAPILRGTSITLTASVTSGGTVPYTYIWKRDAAPLAGGTTLVDTPPPGSHTYSLTAVDVKGCVSTPDQVTVDVFAPPPLTALDLVVADRGLPGGTGSVILVQQATGKQWVSSTGGYLVDPVGVAVDATQRIFVVDASGAVVRIDHATGAQTRISTGGLLEHPSSIAIDAAGRLIVSDFTITISPFATGGGTAVGSAGTVGGGISSVGRIVRVDPVTGAQTLVSSGGLLVVPAGLAIDAKGRLIVTDLGLSGGAALLKVDPATGAQTTIVAGGQFVAPVGVGIDACTGLILVADAGLPGGAGSVIATDAVTHAQATISSAGSFVDPAGLAMLPHPCASTVAASHVAPPSPLLVVADLNAFGNAFDGPGGLIGVAQTGTQAVLSQAGFFIDPYGVAVVPQGRTKTGHPRGR